MENQPKNPQPSADALPENEAESPAGEVLPAPPEDTQKIPQQLKYIVQIGKLRRRYTVMATEDLDKHQGRAVIVDTCYGFDLGILRERAEGQKCEPLGAFVRLADADDLAQMMCSTEADKECCAACAKTGREEKLRMKLAGIDHSYERTKITFYYHAEGRVDFRKLVRSLASRLHKRIELYQLNLRDQFLFHPFFGPCGRELCCKVKPELFAEKIPTRLATQQKVADNPVKMAGVCGKPRCCLKYEVECYKEFGDFLGLRSGRVFRRKDGDAREYRVTDWNMLTNEVAVEMSDSDEEKELIIDLDEFK